MTVLREQTFEGWRDCAKCNQPVYAQVTSDGRSGEVALKHVLDGSRGNVVKVLDFLLKHENEERHVNDLVFVGGKSVENDLSNLARLKVLDKVGYAFRINAKFMPYIEAYVDDKKRAVQSRDVLDEFLG